MTKPTKSENDEQVKMAQALKACLEYLRRDAIEAGLAVTAEMLVLAIEGAAMDLEKLSRGDVSAHTRSRRTAHSRRRPVANPKPLGSVLAGRA